MKPVVFSGHPTRLFVTTLHLFAIFVAILFKCRVIPTASRLVGLSENRIVYPVLEICDQLVKPSQRDQVPFRPKFPRYRRIENGIFHALLADFGFLELVIPLDEMFCVIHMLQAGGD